MDRFLKLPLLLLLVGPAPRSAEPQPHRPRFTVSEATTRITSPLTPEGYVDYTAALDERCRSGIAPDQNGAVPCWEAVGAGAVPESERTAYFARLGMPVPAGVAPYAGGPSRRRHG